MKPLFLAALMMAAPALAQISAADAVSADLAPDAGRKPAETRGLVPTGAAEQARIAIDAALADPLRPLAERTADAQRMPAEVLALLRLEPGQRVLDLVAGAGYYSRLIAPVVGPEGLVFAHSTEGLLTVDGLQPGWSALKRTHPNVRLILGIPGRMNLPGAIDRVLFHLAFHDLWWEDAQYRIPRMDPQAALRDVHAAMKPGGLMLVVDHRAWPGAEPRGETSARHRIDPALVKAEMAKAGFMLEAESDLLASPQDDLGLLVYHPSVRGRTDRFIQLYRRP